jgi:hypothetical protein
MFDFVGFCLFEGSFDFLKFRDPFAFELSFPGMGKNRFSRKAVV